MATFFKIVFTVIAGITGGAMFGLIWHGGDLPSMISLYCSAIPLFLVGLSIGSLAVFASAIFGWATVAYLFGSYASMLFLFADSIPAFLLVFFLLRGNLDPKGGRIWYPLGWALSWLALAGGLIALWFGYNIVGLEAITTGSTETIKQAVVPLLEKSIATVIVGNPELQMSLVVALTPVFMTFVVLLWFTRTLIVAFIAQYILSAMKKALRPSPDYLNIRIQHWLGVLILLSLIVGVSFGGSVLYLALNFAGALALPYFVRAICWGHKKAASFRYSALALIVFYASLFWISYISFKVLGF